MFVFLDNLFKIRQRHSSIKIEIFGGIATFMAMSYIIVVNPNILSLTGMDKNALFTVTCIATAIGTFLSGILGNMPIVLAPAMGLNAFFTFSLVKGQGISWEQALGVVFISGIFYLLLAISGVRKKIINIIPQSISISATVGIGFFIAFIGLRSANLIVANPETLVSLGEINSQTLLSLLGILLMVFFQYYHVRGGILFSIVIVTIFSVLLGLVEKPTEIFAVPPSIAPTLFKLDILGALKWSLGGAIFSFLFIDMFDSLLLILSCEREMKLEHKDGHTKDIDNMLYADLTSTIIGSCLGTSTISACSESNVGITMGARTGLASIVTASLFLIAMFFTPVIKVIPLFATAPALVMVGVYMFHNVTKLDFSDLTVAVPSFLTIILMPLTHNIVIGLSFGFISHLFMYILARKTKEVPLLLWMIGVASVVFLVL
ncbi:MAG: NCS2 family permease [Brevinema sp.]